MGPNTITIKATSEMTGTFSLSETSIAARAPGRRRTRTTPSRHVLRARRHAHLLLGHEEHAAGPGAFDSRPAAGHTFRMTPTSRCDSEREQRRSCLQLYMRELSANAATGR